MSAEPLEPLAVGPESHWNESMYVFWHEPTLGLAGWHRIAQQPNRGHTSTFSCVARADGLRHYVMNEHEPFRAADREGGAWSGDGLRFGWDGVELRVAYAAADCEVALRWSGFHQAVDFGTAVLGPESPLIDLAGEHVEQAGRVSGHVRLGADEHAVDALAYRDHSWGGRDFGRLLCSRWFVGTFGAELSFSGTALVLEQFVVRAGYVVRGGEVTTARSFDVVIQAGIDGLSHPAATGTFEFGDGTTLAVELTGVMGGGILRIDPWVGLESAATARAGGMVGIGNCETGNNLTGGSAMPPLLVGGGAVRPGLHRPHAPTLDDVMSR